MEPRIQGDPYQVNKLVPDSAQAMRLLVFNIGSLSLRYDFLDTQNPKQSMTGEIHDLGSPNARHRFLRNTEVIREERPAPDLETAICVALACLQDPKRGGVDLGSVSAVGHRVLYGAAHFGSAVVVTDKVQEELARIDFDLGEHAIRMSALRCCREQLPKVPHVAVFDNAYFQNLPKESQLYGIPYRYFKDKNLRRYGFLGLSHKYAALMAATHLERPVEWLKMITIHLGHGTSLAAIDHGRPIDTSMGLTPLEGPLMATRSGDIDPGLLLYLMHTEGWSPQQAAQILQKESGLLGISGVSGDMQEVMASAEAGNEGALLALQSYCLRVRKSIGSYAALLGGVDALIFTGGVGENQGTLRARVCQGLGSFGVVLDADRNRVGLAPGQEVASLEHEASRVRVLVVRGDEARMIMRETVRALGREDIDRQLRERGRRSIPIGVSAHHVHLSAEHVQQLFGPGRTLTPKAPLYQQGEYSCEEMVDLIGPRGKVERVRVLGPTRAATQVEISRTEEFKLGVDAPIRSSGNLDGSPGITLVGSAGQVTLKQGLICARRHIHMSTNEAAEFGLKDQDVVRIQIEGERSLIFTDVLIRTKPTYRLEMHLDTDEANAAEISSGMTAILEGIQSRPNIGL